MKNAIIITSVTVLLLGLLLSARWGSTRSGEQAALATGTTLAAITDSIPLYDFGSVSMVKGNVEHEFRVTNTTETDLTVTKAETSCMCTNVLLQLPDGKEVGPFGMAGHGFAPKLNAVVHPGEQLAVRVIFDPAAHGPASIGQVERVATLETNKGRVTMRFRALITP